MNGFNSRYKRGINKCLQALYRVHFGLYTGQSCFLYRRCAHEKNKDNPSPPNKKAAQGGFLIYFFFGFFNATFSGLGGWYVPVSNSIILVSMAGVKGLPA